MYQILNIIKKIIILLILISIIFLSILNNSFAWIKLEVGDVLWKMESIRSESINNANDYCLLYREFDNTIFDKEGISAYDIENIGSKLFNILKSKDVKINKKYLNASIEKAKISKKENKEFIENLEERETENNYKNCDYLILYDIDNGKKGKHAKSYYISIGILIFDIRMYKMTSHYLLSLEDMSFFNSKYPELKNSLLDKLLNKWWNKYQK